MGKSYSEHYHNIKIKWLESIKYIIDGFKKYNLIYMPDAQSSMKTILTANEFIKNNKIYKFIYLTKREAKAILNSLNKKIITRKDIINFIDKNS